MINDWLVLALVYLAGVLTGAAAVAVRSKRTLAEMRSNISRLTRLGS